MNQTLKSFSIVVLLLIILLIIFLGLGSALVPLIFSAILAYLFFPVIKKLESKGIKRSYAVLGIFAILLLLFVTILAIILPNIIFESRTFLEELPQNFSLAIEKIQSLLTQFGYQVDLSKDVVLNFIKDFSFKFSGTLFKNITEGIFASFSGLVACLLAVLNIFLIPVFFFYVMNDYEKISNGLKSFIPPSLRTKLLQYFQLSNTILSGYIRGQLLVALILGLFYATGLFIINLKFGIIIGLFSGLLSIIPYAGFILGFSTAIVMALANYTGITAILGVCVVFGIVQALESTIITPKLVGDKVGLSSLATILALIIGGNLFGFGGMLLAIPIAGICKVLINDLKQIYQETTFFKN